jgi:predicted acyl esterase
MHTFKKGHRLMVQIQSNWFPLVNRNPNVFIDINKAPDSAYQKATITILHGRRYPSGIKFGKLPRLTQLAAG